MTEEETAVREFQQADFQHFAESYWRNEAIGESRLNIFLGLIATVYGAVGFIGKSNDKIDWVATRPLAIAATSALFVIGVLTLLRILKRNASTDDFIKAMAALRSTLAMGHTSHVAHLQAGRTLVSGGTKQFVAIVNTGLVAIFVWLIKEDWVLCACCGSIIFVAQELLIRLIENRYDDRRRAAGNKPPS